MLIGKSSNTIDSKGRLFLPVKWRVDLTDHVVLLYGFGTSEDDKYLQLMSYDRFLELVKTVDGLHPTDLSFIQAQRFIFPNAEEFTPDKQGRILIPQDFIRHAQLGSDVYLLGMGNRIEIWDPKRYENFVSGYGAAQFREDMQQRADTDNAILQAKAIINGNISR